MIEATFTLDPAFKKKLVARYEKHRLEAGILNNRPHHVAKRGVTSVMGGPARKKSSRTSGTVADVGEAIRKTHRVDWLRAPFLKNSKDVISFRKALGDLLTGKPGAASDVAEKLVAVIRGPILRKEYGRNKHATAVLKGFNRFLVDTGQFISAITAKVKKRV